MLLAEPLGVDARFSPRSPLRPRGIIPDRTGPAQWSRPASRSRSDQDSGFFGPVPPAGVMGRFGPVWSPAGRWDHAGDARTGRTGGKAGPRARPVVPQPLPSGSGRDREGERRPCSPPPFRSLRPAQSVERLEEVEDDFCRSWALQNRGGSRRGLPSRWGATRIGPGNRGLQRKPIRLPLGQSDHGAARAGCSRLMGSGSTVAGRLSPGTGQNRAIGTSPGSDSSISEFRRK